MGLDWSLLGLYWVVRKLAWGIPVQGWASLMVAILFLGGIQLLMLGVIGEYLARVYAEVQGRPLYVVEATLGATAGGGTP